MNRHLVFVLSLASVCSVFNSHVAQAASQVVRIDGSLFDNAGIPVTGNKDIQIRAYDASTAGTLLWTSGIYTAAVSAGRFSIDMDASTGGTSLAQRLADAGSSGQIWFEIDYDTGASNGVMNSAVTVTPRIRSKGTLFAVASAKAQSLSGVTATAAEMNYLAGTSANIQTQINTLAAGAGVAKTGDSMTGNLLLLNQKELRFGETTGGGANYLALRAPATLAADLTWTLPSVAGNNGDVLKFDSSTSTFYFDADAGASGGISGPGGSVTANSISRWNGTGATTVKGSGVVIDDTNNITGVNSLSGATLNVSGLTGSRVMVTDGSKDVVSSAVTSTELGYLSGVTSNVGSKLNLLTVAEMGFLSGITSSIAPNLNGLTANVQTQINALATGTGGAVARAGDTMTGKLGLDYAGANTATALILDANRDIVSSAVTSTELGYLSGVTSNLGSKVNLVSAAELGYLAGVTSSLAAKLNPVTLAEVGYLTGATSNIQTQINSINTAGAGALLKAGDTMSGDLGLAGSQATASRALILDASRRIASSSTTNTELDYLSGVTSNVGSKLNLLTVAEMGFLSGITSNVAANLNGLTANVQTQINTLSAASGVSKAGDSMSGALNIGANLNSTGIITGASVNVTSATGSRVLVTDASKNISSSSVTSTELDYLSGITTALSANLNGLTANVQTQINSINTAGAGALLKAGDTMSGDLGLAGSQATAGRALTLDASRRIASSATTNTELGYLSGVTSSVGAKINLLSASEFGFLAGITSSIAPNLNGLTANVQTQINSLAAGAGVSKTGDTMTGNLLLLNQKELRFGENSAGGANYIALRAPAALAADLTWTLPSAAGNNGDVLKFDSSTSTFYFDADAGASGGISGPGGSVTANSISRWNGTGATTVKGSGVIVDDSDNITGVNKLTGATLNVSSLTASRIMMTDGSKDVVSSSVTSTELGYLSGITTALSANLNGLTANVQTQINTISTAGAGALLKAGDTMSGKLGLNYAGANTGTALILNASREVVSSTVTGTELDYLAGVTSNIGTNLNGLTANVQTQINSINTAGAGALLKAGDTMSGDLGLAGSQATASRALILDSSRRIASSATTDTELGYLSGVTSNVGAKLNLLTAAEMGFLSGITSSIAPNLNGLTANVQTQINTLSAASGVSKTGDSMSGVLNIGANLNSTGIITGASVNVTSATGSRVLVTDASKNISSSSVTSTELGYLSGITTALSANLNGLTANVQTQINSINTAGAGALLKAGDTMTGDLGLAGSQATASRALILDASRRIASSSTTNTELDYLSGVTSNVGSKLNLLTVAEMGFLSGITSSIAPNLNGLTANVQTQINALATGTGGAIARAGDTMTGKLGLDYAGANTATALILDANRDIVSSAVTSTELGYLSGVTSNLGSKVNLVSAAELGFLSGVTSSLAAKLNPVTVAEVGYLAGATSNIQTQINSINTAGAGALLKAGDTMSGDLGLAGSQATASRALILDASRRIASSATTNTELDYLSGVTSNVGAKLNLLTAAEMGFLSGITSNVAANLNGLTANVQTQINTLSAASGVSKTGDSMSGVLNIGANLNSTGIITGASVNVTSATGSRVLVTDASKNISSSSVTSTELGYLSGITTALSANLNGLTANVQTQINSINTAGAGALLKAGDTMTGDLGLAGSQATASRALILDASRRIASSSTTNTELDYLSGVTSNVGAKLNLLTAAEMGFLSGITSNVAANLNGLTANVQTQINTLSAASGVSKTGDSMSGVLNIGANLNSTGIITGASVNVTSATGSRVLVTDASKNISSSSVTSTELGYLSGITSSIAPNLNGLTANVQTQINALATGTGGSVARAGDTMTGKLGLDYAGANTATALILDANRDIVSSAVTSTELGYLSGVTSSLAAKLNPVTLAEVGYLTGATANIQTQINSINTAGAGSLLKAGDTMTGDLGLEGSQATASRALILDASRRIASSSTTNTELGYLSGVTSNLGSKVNLVTAAELGYLAGVTSALSPNLNGLTDLAG